MFIIFHQTRLRIPVIRQYKYTNFILIYKQSSQKKKFIQFKNIKNFPLFPNFITNEKQSARMASDNRVARCK